jgi:Tfp pilus assembly protein PilE
MGQDLNAGKSNKAVMVVVIVLVAGFFGIAMLGIVAAIAIPQFTEYRSRGGDASARAELMKAQAACDTYLGTHETYPESLEQAGFKPAVNVTVDYQRVGDEGYSITAVHQNGRRVFAVVSNDAAKIYVKQKNAPDSEFKPLE